jgi:hypothetical protein
MGLENPVLLIKYQEEFLSCTRLGGESTLARTMELLGAERVSFGSSPAKH